MSETKKSKPEVFKQGTDQVGESPLWEPTTGLLYWVDIWGKRVNAIDYGGLSTTWDLPSETGFITRDGGDSFLLGLRNGIYKWRPNETARELAIPSNEPAANRFNDGKTDRQGRIWTGTMSTQNRVPTGNLYRMSTRGQMTVVDTDLVVPNTLAWNPTGNVMYFSDSWYGAIHAYSYDPESGERFQRRVFVEADPDSGDPDGACVDVDGCLWVARFKRGAIFRYTPAGKVDRVIDLPVDQVTSCAFGG
jgi:sugar lactone lactonase YvrE